MGAHRTDMHRLQELVRLHRLGRSRRDVARLLGMGRDTIRQYEAALAAAGLLDGPEADLPSLEALGEAVRVHAPPAAPPRQQRSKVELHRDEIERQRLKGAQPKAIHDWLRLTQPDYQGSLAAVKRKRPAIHIPPGDFERWRSCRVQSAASRAAFHPRGVSCSTWLMATEATASRTSLR